MLSLIHYCLGKPLVISIEKDIEIVDGVSENGTIIKLGGLGTELESEVKESKKNKHYNLKYKNRAETHSIVSKA